MHWSSHAYRITATVLVGALACSLPAATQAQMLSDRGPSIDQLVQALPDSLAGYTRTETGRWETAFGHSVFERASGPGPPAIDVRLAHGRKTQAKVEALFRRKGTDTTITAAGDTVYAIAGRIIGTESADLLWTHGNYALWMSARGSSGEAVDPATAHERLRAIVNDRISADRLPEVRTEAFPKPSLSPADGFETPEGFSVITGQYGGAMNKAARLSIAYPSEWTALDASKVNAFAKVLHISHSRAAAKKRWYGTSDTEGELSYLYAADEVTVQVAGPGMVTNFVGRVTPMGAIKPEEVTSRLKNPTVLQPPTETEVGGNPAAVMEISGTSGDGYAVRHRMVCVESGGAVPCVTVTRPADRNVVSDETIEAMIESVTAEVITEAN